MLFSILKKIIDFWDGLDVEDGLGKSVLLEATCPVVRMSTHSSRGVLCFPKNKTPREEGCVDGHVQHDGFGRDINYLRIAVTDKCNFRCIYCMPADGVAPRAHDELLSAEEIARFVRLVAGRAFAAYA